jgi:hypothetical protein
MQALPEALAGRDKFRKLNVPQTNTDKTAMSTLMSSVRGKCKNPHSIIPFVPMRIIWEERK